MSLKYVFFLDRSDYCYFEADNYFESLQGPSHNVQKQSIKEEQHPMKRARTIIFFNQSGQNKPSEILICEVFNFSARSLHSLYLFSQC